MKKKGKVGKKAGGNGIRGKEFRARIREEQRTTAAITARIENAMAAKLTNDGGNLALVAPSKPAVQVNKFHPKKRLRGRR